MAVKHIDKPSEVQQVLIGFGLGVGAILAVRFAGFRILSLGKKIGPSLAAGQIAKFILADTAIGRVALIDPQVKPSVLGVALTLFTVTFWMFGGLDIVVDTAEFLIGEPVKPKVVPDFAFDQPLSPPADFMELRSPGGALQAITYNPARIDP